MASNGPINHASEPVVLEAQNAALIISPAGRFVRSPRSGKTRFVVGNNAATQNPVHNLPEVPKRKPGMG